MYKYLKSPAPINIKCEGVTTIMIKILHLFHPGAERKMLILMMIMKLMNLPMTFMSARNSQKKYL